MRRFEPGDHLPKSWWVGRRRVSARLSLGGGITWPGSPHQPSSRMAEVDEHDGPGHLSGDHWPRRVVFAAPLIEEVHEVHEKSLDDWYLDNHTTAAR